MPVSYSPQEIAELPVVLSAPRFATYLAARGNDTAAALALYQWNCEVSAAFMAPLHVCEIALRNAVAEALEKAHGAQWPYSTSFARSLPTKSARLYDPKRNLQEVAARYPTTGKVVAELNFAFWQQLFVSGQDQRLWNRYLHRVFPGIAPTVTPSHARATAYGHIQTIRSLRNRIAHHEPVFARKLSIDLTMTKDVISWRSSVARQWVDRIEIVSGLLSRMP